MFTARHQAEGTPSRTTGTAIGAMGTPVSDCPAMAGSQYVHSAVRLSYRGYFLREEVLLESVETITQTEAGCKRSCASGCANTARGKRAYHFHSQPPRRPTGLSRTPRSLPLSVSSYRLCGRLRPLPTLTLHKTADRYLRSQLAWSRTDISAFYWPSRARSPSAPASS